MNTSTLRDFNVDVFAFRAPNPLISHSDGNANRRMRAGGLAGTRRCFSRPPEQAACSHAAFGDLNYFALNPGVRGELFLQGGFEFGIGGGFEGGPVQRGFEALAVGGAEPKLDRQAPFADARMFLQPEDFVQFHVRFRGVGAAVVVAGFFGIEKFQLFFVEPGNGGRGQFVEPLQAVPAHEIAGTHRARGRPGLP